MVSVCCTVQLDVLLPPCESFSLSIIHGGTNFRIYMNLKSSVPSLVVFKRSHEPLSLLKAMGKHTFTSNFLPRIPPSPVFTDLNSCPLLPAWQFFRRLFAFVSLHCPLLCEPRRQLEPGFPCNLSRSFPFLSLCPDQPHRSNKTPLDSFPCVAGFLLWQLR